MKIRRYFYKYGLRVAALLLLVVLVTVIGSGMRGGEPGMLRNAAGSVTMPLKKAAAAVVGWMETIYNTMYRYDLLVEENQQLRSQIAELQEQARNYQEVFDENERLHVLLDFQEKHRSFDTESARIVSWDSSNYTSAFTVNKGEDAGIETGDSVITEYGVLVGQVTETGSNWATVRTVIDTGMSVGALVGVSGYAGMVVGEFSLMREGRTRITYLTGGGQIFKDDEVLTSGAGGTFPSGLLIGTVAAVMSEAGGQTTYGIVEPSCDLSSLSQVFIIKDYSIVE